MNDKLLIIIPFSGFYESLHSEEIDQGYNDLIADENGEPFEELQDDLWLHANSAPCEPYAAAYADAFNDYLMHEHDEELGLTFESLHSPLYYNFTTDRIFCHIPADSVLRMRSDTPDNVLQDTIRQNHTSRSGFISSYPNTIEGWPESVLEWDHNQLATLLEAWLISKDEDMYELSFSVYDHGNLYEAAANAIDATMGPELTALSDKAYAMREKEASA